MKTRTRTRRNRNLVTWSGLPPDLVGSISSRLSLADFHRAKLVCRNWSLSCKLAVTRKPESPWLILFPNGENGCMLYNPDEDKVYKSLRDFSGTRFLANSGKWFLKVDSRTNLYIIDIFSEKRIDLPPLECIRLSKSTFTRIGDETFTRKETIKVPITVMKAKHLKGLLYVDENTQDYVVVWYFYYHLDYLTYCKKGDGYYTDIPLHVRVPKSLQRCNDVVLRGYRLYISTIRDDIRVLDLSGQKIVDVTGSNPYGMYYSMSTREDQSNYNIVVTMTGEVLLVESLTVGEERSFHISKKDPNRQHKYFSEFHAVDSLGDEAVLFDLGITVPANHTLGIKIKPNSIYFTRHDRAVSSDDHEPCLDICVFDLETNTLKRFPSLGNMNLKDARWFLPMT